MASFFRFFVRLVALLALISASTDAGQPPRIGRETITTSGHERAASLVARNLNVKVSGAPAPSLRGAPGALPAGTRIAPIEPFCAAAWLPPEARAEVARPARRKILRIGADEPPTAGPSFVG